MDNVMIKNLNETMYNYAVDSTRKTMEFQTTMFKEWMAVNQKLVELTPFAKLWPKK